MRADWRRRLVAECLGTGLLVATVVGSGIMAERLTDDVGLALLGNTVATGAMLFVLISVFAPLSGAHLNPAVTLAGALERSMNWASSMAYMAAQISGAIAGTVLAHLMFDLPVLVLGDQPRTGASQWLSEGVATFGLVLTILMGIRHRPAAVPALVACYITAAYWFTASTSFANPAVTIARALTDSFSGLRPIDVPAFIAAQIVGAILALAIGGWLEPKEKSA
jgi:glycerol uptake facilitator-like aquaporin